MTKTLLNLFKIIIPIFLLFVSLDFRLVQGEEITVDVSEILNDYIASFGGDDKVPADDDLFYNKIFLTESECANNDDKYECTNFFEYDGEKYAILPRLKRTNSINNENYNANFTECSFFEKENLCDTGGETACLIEEFKKVDVGEKRIVAYTSYEYPIFNIDFSDTTNLSCSGNNDGEIGDVSTIYSVDEGNGTFVPNAVIQGDLYLATFYNYDFRTFYDGILDLSDTTSFVDVYDLDYIDEIYFKFLESVNQQTNVGKTLIFDRGDYDDTDGCIYNNLQAVYTNSMNHGTLDNDGYSPYTACFRMFQWGETLWPDDVAVYIPKGNTDLMEFFNLEGKEEHFYSANDDFPSFQCINNFQNNPRVDMCKMGDIFLPALKGAKVIGSNDYYSVFCGSSFNKYNLSIGKHCLANYGQEFDENKIQVCGIAIPYGNDVPSIIRDDFQEVQICSPLNSNTHNKCVGWTNDQRDTLKIGYVEPPDNADRMTGELINYPNQGICLNCVENEGDACNIIAEDATASELNIIDTFGIYDNCCDTDLFCRPNSEGSSEGICTKRENFNYCTANEEFILPGEVCNYIYDGDTNNQCDLCATTGATTKDDEGNDLCPEIAYDPTLDVVTSGCRSECGCPTTIERCTEDPFTNEPICEDFGVEYYCQISSGSNTGSCTLNECVPDGEKATGNLECCNDNSTINDEGICEVSCVGHIPGDTCLNACCDEDECLSCDSVTKECVDKSAPCYNRSDGSCFCGANRICSNGSCTNDTSGNCSPDNKTRPPKGGYPRPQAVFSLDEFITVVISILYPLSVILAMIFIVVGGYKLMISKGDPKGVKQAQETLTNAILGLIFIILSATLLRFVLNVILNV